MIRKAVKNDLNEILILYQQLFFEMAAFDRERLKPAEQSSDFINDAIEDPDFHFLVADFDNKIKGFCIAQKQSAPAYSCVVPRNFAYIFDLVVAPDARNEKIGHKLLSEMKDWAKKNRLSHLELSVISQNRKAIKFYEREGLTELTRKMGIKL